MLFNSDINMTYIAGFAGLGAAGVFAAVKRNLFADYAAARIPIWKDPFSDPRGLGYQTIQSLYAIASGGIFGLGLGKSRQKQLYLPEAYNDYVFAIVCEELVMVVGLAVILLFAVLIIRGFWIAMHARDRFGAMLVVGIMTNVALQTVLNIAVVTNTIPVTGISLPFFSYGGSSLVMLLAEMGIVLSVSKQMYVESMLNEGAFRRGGTAGHINPAIAGKIRPKAGRPSAGILFIESSGGKDKKLVREAGFELETISHARVYDSVSPKPASTTPHAGRQDARLDSERALG